MPQVAGKLRTLTLARVRLDRIDRMGIVHPMPLPIVAHAKLRARERMNTYVCARAWVRRSIL